MFSHARGYPRRFIAADLARGDRLPVFALSAAFAALPLLTPKGPGNTAPADLFLAGAVLVGLVWAGTVGARVRIPYAVPAAVLLVAGALAGIAGDAPRQAVIALTQEIFLLAFAAAIATVCRAPASLSSVLATWAWSAIVWAGILVLSVAGGIRSISGVAGAGGGRANFTFDHPNLAASYFGMSLFVVLVARRPRNTAVRAAGLATLFLAVFFTGSNAALIGVFVGGSVVAAARLMRRVDALAGLAILAMACLCLAGVAYVVTRSGTASVVDRSTNPYLRYSVARGDRSLEARTSLFRAQLDLFRETPVIGRGPASTRTSLASTGVERPKEAHNDYLAALVERGVLGALGLVLLMGAVAVRLRGAASRGLEPDYARVIPGTAALTGAAVMLAVSAATHEVLHYRHVWALFGILAAVYAWGRTQSDADGDGRSS